jgi:glycosyltransferase involved in cell wall biosynthesis
MKLAIVIAAYNEGGALGSVLAGLPKSLDKITTITPVVVDDGSRDETSKVAAQFPGAVVLRHVINCGQGGALRTGFDYAIQEDYDVVVTFDADGQHSSAEIQDMIEPILKGEVDVVLGSRFLDKKAVNIPRLRKAILKAGIIFTRLLSHVNVTDTHNGFRALSISAVARMDLHQDKMEHASEILDQLYRQGISYKEMPVTIRYSDYSKAKGQRTSNAVRIAVKMIIHKLAQ